MRVVRPPGVYAPQGDTALLMESLAREELGPSARTLDLCTGTGVLAIAAARRGAEATAVDVSGVSAATARVNATLHRCRIRVLRGDLTAPVTGERFDLVTVNPPYVPALPSRGPPRGPGLAWDAGPDGRLLLDRICHAAPALLVAHGVLLLVQSSLSGVSDSLAALERRGLRAYVAARRTQPFGPVTTARAGWLRERGLIPPKARTEQLVVIRAVLDAAGRPGSGGEGTFEDPPGR
ncbi:methyltransferase [Streptomyces sp. R302]|uniref:HemK2/MTQ2 family protein methyltransferase n=1 Tax=unclassified Streptomyces TaxID=2593676 RepID=UPI00145C962F|nr:MULTISPECIES: HemK2/MTQ2 family protein methyltransferase [unclassified Streptomyces]NML50839.1 methyltransferase [Streptomyces sp. R301]NML80933.1 methyltransferase [Streptomyces sp. R302]